jgi:hypothetical protein
VVCFVTKSTRDQHIDPPRAIECEVINKKIDRKNWDRKIVINRLLDYDKEMEWIAPLRSAEEVKTSKAEKQAIKAQKRKEKAVAKKRAKEKAQSLKSNK